VINILFKYLIYGYKIQKRNKYLNLDNFRFYLKRLLFKRNKIKFKIITSIIKIEI